MNQADLQHLRAAIAASVAAREHGNKPFGAVLVDDNGNLLLQAENTELTEQDCTGHAETSLMREASRRYDPDTLANCTLYASTEPCAMCAAAIYWGGVGRVVYALSGRMANELAGKAADQLNLSYRDVFARGQRRVEVIGPMIETEAEAPVREFWGVTPAAYRSQLHM